MHWPAREVFSYNMCSLSIYFLVFVLARSLWTCCSWDERFLTSLTAMWSWTPATATLRCSRESKLPVILAFCHCLNIIISSRWATCPQLPPVTIRYKHYNIQALYGDMFPWHLNSINLTALTFFRFTYQLQSIFPITIVSKEKCACYPWLTAIKQWMMPECSLR